jgi:HNH endonuclease
MAKTDLTAARLRELLDYDPNTGRFIWRSDQKRKPKPGAVAGCDDGSGYVRISIDGSLYRAHRLAWLFTYGQWPKNDIDHIDCNRSNNAITNLRDATRSINLQNQRRARSDNKSSGLLGVYKDAGRWKSKIRVGEDVVLLGRFDTSEEAHKAYVQAKRKLHPGCTI